jgi:hypothetical protein
VDQIRCGIYFFMRRLFVTFITVYLLHLIVIHHLTIGSHSHHNNRCFRRICYRSYFSICHVIIKCSCARLLVIAIEILCLVIPYLMRERESHRLEWICHRVLLQCVHNINRDLILIEHIPLFHNLHNCWLIHVFGPHSCILFVKGKFIWVVLLWFSSLVIIKFCFIKL